MRTTPYVVDFTGLTRDRACEQIREQLEPCCREALRQWLSTTDPALIHWLTDTACDHSKLCQAWEPCTMCGREVRRCRHCGPRVCGGCLERIKLAGPAMDAAATHILTERQPGPRHSEPPATTPDMI